MSISLVEVVLYNAEKELFPAERVHYQQNECVPNSTGALPANRVHSKQNGYIAGRIGAFPPKRVHYQQNGYNTCRLGAFITEWAVSQQIVGLF